MASRFLALVQHRFHGGGLYLDEPEAALSPMRQMTLLARLNECRFWRGPFDV
jgi:predicted ATPase